jgi:FkbM family methyltransferase
VIKPCLWSGNSKAFPAMNCLLSNAREHEAVRQVLAGTADPIIVELGAYDGCDTVRLYDALRPGIMLATEPDPRLWEAFRQRVGNRHVIMLPVAVGACIGQTVLYLSDPPGSSSVRRPKRHLELFPHVQFQSVQTVMICTLNAIFQELKVPRIDLLWCDVQGAERDVIAGGQWALRHTRYALLECDLEELYEGQLVRPQLLDALPGWEIIGEWPDNGNVLLRNTRYAASGADARTQ